MEGEWRLAEESVRTTQVEEASFQLQEGAAEEAPQWVEAAGLQARTAAGSAEAEGGCRPRSEVAEVGACSSQEEAGEPLVEYSAVGLAAGTSHGLSSSPPASPVPRHS